MFSVQPELLLLSLSLVSKEDCLVESLTTSTRIRPLDNGKKYLLWHWSHSYINGKKLFIINHHWYKYISRFSSDFLPNWFHIRHHYQFGVGTKHLLMEIRCYIETYLDPQLVFSCLVQLVNQNCPFVCEEPINIKYLMFEFNNW